MFPVRYELSRVYCFEEIRLWGVKDNTFYAGVMWVSYVSGVAIKTQNFGWRRTYIKLFTLYAGNTLNASVMWVSYYQASLLKRKVSNEEAHILSYLSCTQATLWTQV
jgi:hypothetical protein